MTLQAGSSTCRCCGKALTDSLSVELGIGPVCRITAKTKEAKDMNGNLFSNRADPAEAMSTYSKKWERF